MKIEGNRAELLNQGLERVGGPTLDAGNRTTPDTPSAAATDAVTLSDAAKLMRTAMQAVGQAPAVRQDVVERMRAALEQGEIGNDPGVLADALIDSWTGEK